MKIVKCDICPNEVFTAPLPLTTPADTDKPIPIPQYWVKLIAKYVSRNVSQGDASLDLCNICYFRLVALIKLFKQRNGDMLGVLSPEINEVVNHMAQKSMLERWNTQNKA